MPDPPTLRAISTPWRHERPASGSAAGTYPRRAKRIQVGSPAHDPEAAILSLFCMSRAMSPDVLVHTYLSVASAGSGCRFLRPWRHSRRGLPTEVVPGRTAESEARARRSPPRGHGIARGRRGHRGVRLAGTASPGDVARVAWAGGRREAAPDRAQDEAGTSIASGQTFQSPSSRTRRTVWSTGTSCPKDFERLEQRVELLVGHRRSLLIQDLAQDRAHRGGVERHLDGARHRDLGDIALDDGLASLDIPDAQLDRVEQRLRVEARQQLTPDAARQAQLLPDAVLLSGARKRTETLEVLCGNLGECVGDHGAGAIRRCTRSAGGDGESERDGGDHPGKTATRVQPRSECSWTKATPEGRTGLLQPVDAVGWHQ